MINPAIREAVVVPSPHSSFDRSAASMISFAPIFSKRHSVLYLVRDLATVTPSLVIVTGCIFPLSTLCTSSEFYAVFINTFLPPGPRVRLTHLET